MRANALQSYLDAKISAFRPQANVDPELASFLDALVESTPEDIRRSYDSPDRPTRRDFLADPTFKRALDNIPDGSEPGATLDRIAPHLDWSIVFHGPEAPQALSETMHVAALTYRPHTPAQEGMHAGLFVLHPHLDYPLHSHIANEVYYCISGNLTIRHGVDGKSFSLGPGDYSITPSECIHSLHTGEEPVILSYVWRGDLGAPNWWWHQDAQGNWLRERWQWEDNYDWRSYGSEPVTADIMALANP